MKLSNWHRLIPSRADCYILSRVNVCPAHMLTSEPEFVKLLWNLFKIESLTDAHKQHPVGLLTFTVIQTYLPDTCLESGQSEARPCN